MYHFNSTFRNSTFLIFLLIYIGLTPTVAISQYAENFHKDHPELSLKLEQQAKSIYKDHQLKGDLIIAVVDENGLVYSFALNEEIIAGAPSNLDENSLIYIASHTKSFTGTLLKILEEQGKLSLEASLASHLPELRFQDSIDTELITVKSLLNHTHGFFSTPFTWKTAFLGYSGQNSELIHDLNTDFQHDPSRVFRYSNVGPIVAGMVVEEITGNSWKEEMQQHIFQPLQMHSTSANVSDLDLEAILPFVMTSRENGVVTTAFPKKDISMHASGGILSTINDLSKWLSANIRQDENLLSKTSWAQLHTATTQQDKEYFTYHRKAYSLGWDIAEYQEDILLTRFGGLAGYSFHISFMPEKKIGVIAFANDNRAYLLPHLMANYAYNQFNSLPADSILEAEKIRFLKAFAQENEVVYPKDTDLLKSNADNDSLLGTYHSTSGWPRISISREGDHYLLHWGILTGKIYTTPEGFTSNLGVLTRDFKINKETLETGSLIYKKE